MQIQIEDKEIERMKDVAIEQAVSKIVAQVRSKVKMDSFIESAKSRLINELKKAAVSKIVEGVNVEQIMHDAVEEANKEVSENIQKALKNGVHVSITI